ncbi:MAG TPA: RnfABCDGE type electron transport complex subunit G [Bacteroidales bacterium]|nr:RnfABCDGE type electron transport complex subunit G [Bacteroidales bacterium]
MAKTESTFKNMLLTLFLVTFIASGTLGFVYEFTKEPIRMVEINKKNEAIKDVFPGFTNEPYQESFKVAAGKDSLTFYPAKADGKLIGVAVETYTNKGFSGLITLMVGFKMDGTITSIKVLSHQETPGLGQKIERDKSNFETQFEGKNPATFKLMVKKDQGNVDAITASTISSRAYCDAVQRAYDGFEAEKEKLENEKN